MIIPPQTTTSAANYNTSSLYNAIGSATTIAALNTAFAPMGSTYGATITFWTTAPSGTDAYAAGSTLWTDSDIVRARQAAFLIAAELSKYHPSFVVGTRLTAINIVRDVLLFNGAAGNFAYAYNDEFWTSTPADVTTTAQSQNYQRVFHHEFFHVIDASWTDGTQIDYVQWGAANPTGFVYGQTWSQVVDGHPRGFVDAFATTSAVEDSAQIHSALMAQPRYSLFRSWLPNDISLTNKVAFHHRFLGAHNTAMGTSAYYDSINGISTTQPPPPSTPSAPPVPTVVNKTDNTWTLLHMRSPLNTTQGTGQYGELTKASGRRFTFNGLDADTLSWSMPGNHIQTARIEPLVDDVLVFRGDEAVQRYRVVTRSLSKDSGVLSASFTAVSYRALLDAWVFHDGDTRSFPNTEQTAAAWTIISQGQQKLVGNLGITRGKLPARAVMRVSELVAPINVDNTVFDIDGNPIEPQPGDVRAEYFAVGQKRSEAINTIAAMSDGFEWDIQPDPADPYRKLVFNTWNVGARNQHAVRSPLVLDDGGSMMSWSHTITPTDYGNVIRATGSEATAENTTQFDIDGNPIPDTATATNPAVPAWEPETQNPVLPAPEGRWERDIALSELTTQAAVNAAVQAEYDKAHLYVPEITASLRRGRWQGPTHLWLGDKARLIITELVEGFSDEYILYVDEDVKVVEVSVDVDDLGAEDISVSLNRPTFSSQVNTRKIADRLTRLERR